LLSLNKAFISFKPDAVIYGVGVYIHQNDDLGHIDISTQGVLACDNLVFDYCKLKGLPIAAVIGGGYQRDIEALVNVHLQLFVAAGVIT
jgi:acetoin utilization deacetylase AcuC-like enzyme